MIFNINLIECSFIKNWGCYPPLLFWAQYQKVKENVEKEIKSSTYMSAKHIAGAYMTERAPSKVDKVYN